MVIDTRGEGNAVRLEAMLMFDPQRVRKALFIVTPDGRCPALDVHGMHPANHGIPTVTEDELIPRLREWTQSVESLPCPVDLSDIGPNQDIPSETFRTLPTLLMIALSDSFDSREVLASACATDRDLVAICASRHGEDSNATQWLFDLTWEFIHDRRLALIVFRRSQTVLFRVEFLRAVAGEIAPDSARNPSGRLTFEQLSQPEPVWAAVHGWAGQLRELAERKSLSYRFIMH